MALVPTLVLTASARSLRSVARWEQLSVLRHFQFGLTGCSGSAGYSGIFRCLVDALDQVLFRAMRYNLFIASSEAHTMSKPSQPMLSITLLFAQRPALAVAVSLAAVLVLGGCGKADDGKTVGQKVDSALEKTEQAAAVAKIKTEDAMANAGAALRAATEKGEAASKNMADKVEKKFDDASITTAVNAGLAKNSDLRAFQINVDTKNGLVSLKGSAPTAAAKERASEITKAVKGVTTVDNQLIVKPS